MAKEPKRKATAIPRLNKKMSFDSATTFCNEFQEENVLNRTCSDPSYHLRTLDEPIPINNKTKKLCKFTLNESFISSSKNEEVDGGDEAEEDVNSNMSGERNQIKPRNESDINEKDVSNQKSELNRNSSPERHDELSSTDDDNNINAPSDVLAAINQMNNIENNAENSVPSTCRSFRSVGNNSNQMSPKTQKKSNRISSKPSNNSYQVPPLEIHNIQNLIDQHRPLRNTLGNGENVNRQYPSTASLENAYLKRVNSNQRNVNPPWHIVNPLYTHLDCFTSRPPQNFFLNPKLVSDIDVKGLVQMKEEEFSDIETDEETTKPAISPRLSNSKTNPYNLHNTSKDKTADALPKQHESILKSLHDANPKSIVNAFYEVFGSDCRFVDMLTSKQTAKYDDRFRKIREGNQEKEMKMKEASAVQSKKIKDTSDVQDGKMQGTTIVQDSPRDTLGYESCKSRLIDDLYKNDDVFSTITQSSNDRSLPDNVSTSFTPRVNLKQSKLKSGVSIKTCGCEIKHLQLNDVQKSIADISSGMKMMLATFATTNNEDMLAELVALRTLYEDCLLYQRKTAMQNRKLINDIHHICFTVTKILEKQQSRTWLKYLVLPILGIITYFVVTHFELCKKIHVCESVANE